jgi:hydrogenase maturation protease
VTGPQERPLRLAVVGLGNRLQGDEALGSLVIEQLAARVPGELDEQAAGQIELIDGGTVGLGLLPYLDDLDGLIVVDAVEHDAPAGSLIDLEGDPLRPATGPMGVHELGAAELLGALVFQGRLPPRVRIIGLQPERISVGLELSPPVAAAVPELLDRIIGHLRTWTAEVV